jgi:hypothetical protein
MDRQRRICSRKRPLNTADGTEFLYNRTTHSGLPTYEISSLQRVHVRLEAVPTLNQNDDGATDPQRALDGGWKQSAQSPSPTLPSSSSATSTLAPQLHMLVPRCDHFDRHLRTVLQSAVRRPPVTTNTLVELDLNWIFHNIHLRSDINFESGLHFMPVKGLRAESKRRESHDYWLALVAELQMYTHARQECTATCTGETPDGLGSFTPRIPQMFTDLRALLETLVSDKDLAGISANFDIPFLMQQMGMGVLDIPHLANWVASVLKSNCAPIRDEWANDMAQEIEEGARASDMKLLVSGLKKLFSFLEAMRLVN